MTGPGKLQKVGKFPKKKMSCKPLVDVLKEKLKHPQDHIVRKWIKCKLRELGEEVEDE